MNNQFLRILYWNANGNNVYMIQHFTNDIPTIPKAHVSLFADDTLFYINNKNPKRAVIRPQKQLDVATIWFDQWRIRLNLLLTITILFD